MRSLPLDQARALRIRIQQELEKRTADRIRQELEQDADTIRARCGRLSGFVKAAWKELEPDQPLVWNWHLDALCDHLEAVTDGRITRLLVNVPPGSSKSLIVSVLWPAWEWGPIGRRSLRYLTTAFNDGPVKRDTRKSRDLILSDWYRALWPEVVLTRTAELSFANSDTGTREGIPFGSLTSQRGNRLIIDDPHSTESAESDAERTTTTRKFREGAVNRLNDQAKDAIIVIMQRLHEKDISGTILSLGMEYVHLCLPMEFEPERRCSTKIGFVDPRQNDGDLLDPVRFPRAEVDKLKRDMGSYAYAGQYQQRPTAREGGLFKRHWFEFVGAVPAETIATTRAWDLGATKGGGDPTAGVKMTRDQRGVFYVLHVARDRLGPNEVEQLIRNTSSQDGRAVRIRLPQDPGAAGKSYAATLIGMLAGYDVKATPPTGDKATRATPAAAQAEAGNVKILQTGDPVRDAWIEPFIAELCGFPSFTHDDQVDAFADALNDLALTPIQSTTITSLRI